MKKALGLMTGLFVFAAVNVWAAISIDSIVVTGTNSSTTGAVTISATISGGSASNQVFFFTTSTNGLNQRNFPPEWVVGTSWSNSSWSPYFTGTFIIDINAVDLAGYPPSSTNLSVSVTVTRTTSGTVNSIQYSSAPYNATSTWSNIDTNKVTLHDIGLNLDVSGVGSLGCNLINVTNVTPDMTAEQQDIAYTDTSPYKPFGTPYRFNVSLHARPRGFMGMGEIKRWIWAPANTNVPDGPGQLTVDITSCSPWRSSYSNALQSHVGFAPLFAPTNSNSNGMGMPTGMIQCTSAHYMDVSPTNSGSQADARCGLRVNGHTGTNSYLKTFLSDTFLQQQYQLTNALDATNVMAGFVQHFGVSTDSVAEVAASFTRIVGGTGTNLIYDYNFDGVGDSGYEVRFDFEFQSAVAAMMGIAAEPSASVEGDFDGDKYADPYWPVKSNILGMWTVWMSSGGYAKQGPFDFSVPGGEPVRAADFDGDGYADPVMVANGNWYVWMTSAGYVRQGPFAFSVAGLSSVDYLAADFDGDRYADPALEDEAGNWYIWMTSGGYARQGPFTFAVPGGEPMAADFDGDRYADPAMVLNGAWTIWFTSLGYAQQGPFTFAVAGDDPMPMVGDFDGDRYADPAMVVDHNWTIWLSSGGYASQGPYPFVP